MKSAVILSIAVKGLGALLEILIQIMISRYGSVELFGTYSFYVSAAELVCWLLFSAIVKINAFYVSNGYDIRTFRRNYLLLFALPACIALSIFGAFYSLLLSIAVAGAFLYACQLNLSSVFLACRQYKTSLFGEYLISRAIIAVGVVVLIASGGLSEVSLVIIYCMGFLASIVYFLVTKSKLHEGQRQLPAEARAGLKKQYAVFQMTDVANSLVNQAPVIVQYCFSGAYQAGVLSVILVTKKIMSFVAGPTAKVYLPEFAKRHAEGDLTGLRSTYREIILLQMCFVLPLCFMILSIPDLLLFVYNGELVAYSQYMREAGIVFLIMVVFGPQGNLLSMVGKERIEAATKWISLLCMVGVMAMTYGNEMFVFYGIAAQVIVDSLLKQVFLIRELKGFPLSFRDCLILFVPFVVLSILGSSLHFGFGARLAVSALCALCMGAAYMLCFFKTQVMDRVSHKRR